MPLVDPVARRGGVFVVSVLVALIGGFFIGKASVPPVRTPPAADGQHVHQGGGGFSLDLGSPVFAVGAPGVLTFTVRTPDAATLTHFETRHDKRIHVIVLRSDLSGYQHLHPSMEPGGRWSVPLTLGAAGTWWVFADFTTVGSDGALVDDTARGTVFVPGEFAPVALPPAAGASVGVVSGSGFSGSGVDTLPVTAEGGLRAGGTSPVTMRVPSGGPLERYLGAFGHLVVVRAGDLSFVHVHPDERLTDGGGVRFWVTVPGPGTYRAYFDFQISGVVRTAGFTFTANNK